MGFCTFDLHLRHTTSNWIAKYSYFLIENAASGMLSFNKDLVYFIEKFTVTLQRIGICAVELQWLEHRWLVYHGSFELVLEFLGKNYIAADIYYIWDK